MAQSTPLTSVRNATLIPAGFLPATSSCSGTKELFKATVQDSIREQIQQCTVPSQRDVLTKIYDDFHHVASETIPDSVLPGKTDELAFSEESVLSFISRLKQNKLHQYDQELSLHNAGLAENLAQPAFRLAQAESRLTALNAAHKITVQPLLMTCLEEHIAAASKQKEVAKNDLFIAQLPDVHSFLCDALTTNRSAVEKCNAERKDEMINRVREVVINIIDNNNGEIKILQNKYSEASERRIACLNEYDQKFDARKAFLEEKEKTLNAIAIAVKNGEIPVVDTVDNNLLTPKILSELNSLSKLYNQKNDNHSLLKQTEIERIKIATDNTSETKSKLTIKQKSLQRVAQQIIHETAVLHTIEDAINERGSLSDFMLRFKRLLGGGKEKKTRSEYSLEQQQHIAAIEQLKSQHQQLTQDVTVLNNRITSQSKATENNLQKFDYDFAKKRILQVKLESQEKLQREKLLNAVLAQQKVNEGDLEQAQKYLVSEELEYNTNSSIESDADEAIRLLKSKNARLETLMRKDLSESRNLDALCSALDVSPEQKKVKEIFSRWQEISPEEKSLQEEIVKIQEVISLLMEGDRYGVNLLTRLTKTNFTGAQEYINKINSMLSQLNTMLPTTSVNVPAELLADTANLFAILCTEKVNNSPFSKYVTEASSVTPATLALLDKLEQEINHSDFMAQQTKNSKNVKITLEEKRKLVQVRIDGLRRIINQRHDKPLLSASDFTAQFFNPEHGIYIDRQYSHGTCVMHSWNNQLAHLSNNQQMMMTPWRMEKLIQSLITLDVHGKLNDLLYGLGKNSHNTSLTLIEQMLSGLLRASELTSLGFIDHFCENGHIMSYEGPPYKHFISSHLAPTSTRLFELYGFKGTPLPNVQFRRRGELSDARGEQSQMLETLREQQYDTLSISFQAPNDGSSVGHALTLIKHEGQYLLIDSNYDDPVSLALTDLVDFFESGQSSSNILDEILINRGYDEYALLVFRYGIHKRNEE